MDIHPDFINDKYEVMLYAVHPMIIAGRLKRKEYPVPVIASFALNNSLICNGFFACMPNLELGKSEDNYYFTLDVSDFIGVTFSKSQYILYDLFYNEVISIGSIHAPP